MNTEMNFNIRNDTEELDFDNIVHVVEHPSTEEIMANRRAKSTRFIARL